MTISLIGLNRNSWVTFLHLKSVRDSLGPWLAQFRSPAQDLSLALFDFGSLDTTLFHPEP